MAVRAIPITLRWVFSGLLGSMVTAILSFRWEWGALLLVAVVVSGCTRVRETPKTLVPKGRDHTNITLRQAILSPRITKTCWTCIPISSPVTDILKWGKSSFGYFGFSRINSKYYSPAMVQGVGQEPSQEMGRGMGNGMSESMGFNEGMNQGMNLGGGMGVGAMRGGQRLAGGYAARSNGTGKLLLYYCSIRKYKSISFRSLRSKSFEIPPW